ncbi:unnamed protein product [Ambrosiozyma monospora]|uniref:Unnamed protein product n=1 Tax=Ambrosiozyma monospora TaxID=43982 RepID=A0A9W7DH51_AMBMO|nr:unnamed protein product [Ambrosiozyma monospora]
MIQGESTIIDPNSSVLPQQQQQQQTQLHDGMMSAPPTATVQLHQKQLISKNELGKNGVSNRNNIKQPPKLMPKDQQNHNNKLISTINHTIQNSGTMIPLASKPQQPLVQKKPAFKRREVTITSKDVLDVSQKFERHHLGSIIYEEYPTFETATRFLTGLKQEDLEQLKAEEQLYKEFQEASLRNEGIKPTGLASPRIELLPSVISKYINCTVDVHVPYHAILNNDNVYNRRLWGTDVYTDDSDIVAILYHCGILNSRDPTSSSSTSSNGTTGGVRIRKSRANGSGSARKLEDKLVDKYNLVYELNRMTKPLTPANLNNRHNVRIANGTKPISSASSTKKKHTRSKSNSNSNIDTTTTTDDLNYNNDDLTVRLLILPTLERYQGTFRNNYNSRTWSKVEHNGVSISVLGVEWCELGCSLDKVCYLSGVRKRLLDERVELEQFVLSREQNKKKRKLDSSAVGVVEEKVDVDKVDKAEDGAGLGSGTGTPAAVDVHGAGGVGRWAFDSKSWKVGKVKS